MKKIVSMVLALTLGASMLQAAHQPGQARNAGTSVAPEVSRTVAVSEDRSASGLFRTRSVGNPAKSFITTPATFTAAKVRKTDNPAMAPRKVAVSPSLDVYGTVIFANTWTSSNTPYGVYKIPFNNTSITDKLFAENANPIFSYFDGERSVYTMYEVAYGSYVMGYDLYVYDTVDKKRVSVIEFDELPIKATDVAFDPTTGKAYGFFSGNFYGQEYHYWGYLDIKKRSVVSIADLNFSLRGVAIDKYGQAYGIGLDGALYKINKDTGEIVKVGETGCPSLYYMSSAAYNDKDNNIVLSYSNEDGGGLVTIDPVTAESSVTTVFPDGDEVIGLYIPFQAPDKAPAAPSLEVVCNEGSMSVDFTIGMPDKLFDGSAVSGELGYKIYANSVEILSGKAYAGSEVKLTKALTESGVTNFIAVATNEAGESTQTKASCYVGKGTPAASSKVALTYADGKFTLTWAPVTESSDGGYIKADDVRYDIVDIAGNLVASDVEGTSWTKEQALPDEITGFSFGVVAKYDGKTSKAVMSNSIYLGHYNAPAHVNLKDAGSFNQHLVIDANGDGKTWVSDTSKGATYKYSSSNAGDDWLVSPAFYLEAGKAYDFEALAHAYSDKYPEKMEICLGTAPTAEAMTTTLVETTTLGGATSSLTASIVPPATGEYYIGFHAVSDPMQWSIYLTDYSISEPYGVSAPDAVTDIVLTPDVTGALNVAGSFKAPAKTVTGAEYSGQMKVTVLRGDVEVATLTAAAGTTQTFTDKVGDKGNYTYTFMTSTLDGQAGRAASASVFVGPNVPLAPTAVKAVENTQSFGELTLSWTAPTADIAGNPLLASNLTYNVYMYNEATANWEVLNSAPLKECTYTFRSQEATAPQAFVQVMIESINSGVKSDEYASPGVVAVGPGYKLPVGLTCLDDARKIILAFDPWDGCEFGMKADGDMSAVTSQDGDGQFFYGERMGSSATLGMNKGVGDFIFGKVDLSGAKNPVFSLYTWKITETDKTKLEIIVSCEGEQKTVSTIDYANDTHNIWTKKVVDLSEFKDKAIQLIIRYYSDGLVYCFFDNMKFMDMPDYDLNAVSVSAPKTVTGGEVFKVTATVENTGRQEFTDFNVELLANGQVVDTKTVASLAVGEMAQIDFDQTISMAQEKVAEYTVRIVSDKDMDDSNNVTAKSAVVTRLDSDLPKVSNLSGKQTADGNVLTWAAITEKDLPYDPTVESFENAESFAKEYPGWVFIDGDGKPCGGTGNIAIPNHTYGVDPESFIVIDGTYSGFVNSSYAKEYRAADGEKYLGSLWTKGDEDNTIATSDDWAISPILKGTAQTVTFCAKNASINYSEYLQVWYSTTDSTNPEDFVQVKSFNNPNYNYRIIRTDGWGEFSVELPEGAVRMAFHVVSNDGMMLMLDKVAYLAADAKVGLEHQGYNVYCDGVKLNDTPLTVPAYTHAETASAHSYRVTAVYNRGESEATDPVYLAATSVEDGLAEAASVVVEDHEIVIVGAADNAVSVVAADGKLIHEGNGDIRVTVTPGFYLVTIGETATKVIVK